MPSASAAWRVGHQQRLHLARLGAELRGEAVLGVIRADADADEQVEVGRGHAVGRGGADDLVELLDRIEAEGAARRARNRPRRSASSAFTGCMKHWTRLGQRLGDQAHFADRRDVIMGDARVPQDLQQVGRRVGLDRIERAARKLLDEEAGGATRGVRTKKRNRLDRSADGDSGTPPDAGRGGG